MILLYTYIQFPCHDDNVNINNNNINNNNNKLKTFSLEPWIKKQISLKSSFKKIFFTLKNNKITTKPTKVISV
jgi:hypothetical protein